jgi:predicted RNA-binding Zn ribbon-like protein
VPLLRSAVHGKVNAWRAGRARRRQRERDALLAHPSEHGAAALAEVHAPEYEREEDVGALRLQDGLHTSDVASLTGRSQRVVVLPEGKFCSFLVLICCHKNWGTEGVHSMHLVHVRNVYITDCI